MLQGLEFHDNTSLNIPINVLIFLISSLLSDHFPFTACPAGMYRPRPDPADSCLPCPANTVRNRVTFATCPCLEGYFRTPQEGQNIACTRKSRWLNSL